VWRRIIEGTKWKTELNMEERVQEKPARSAPRQVVVFADDDPVVLLAMERLLRDEPYDLYMTTEPEKAIEWVRTRPVSVMISDYRMPEMDGTTLLRLARASSPRTARFLLTAYPGECAVLQARETGLLTLFGKPWDPKELKRAIRERVREREIIDGF
jgi:response regulator RpfG family c-di-GMP phosphodiesterase